MAHARQQVRDAVVSVLAGSVAGVWRHVFNTRIAPLRDVRPYLLVYTDSEQAQIDTIHTGSLISRDIAVTVVGQLRVSDEEAVEDAADAMAAEIETVLTWSAVNAQLSGKLKFLELQASSLAIEEDEQQRTAAVLTLDWLVRVFTVEGQPQTLV